MAAGLITTHSSTEDTAGAVGECCTAAVGEKSEFLLLLHGPNHTGKALEDALARHSTCPVYGCSTAGEILPGGYGENGISAIHFSSEQFTCVASPIDELVDFGFVQAGELVPALKEKLLQRAPGATPASTFALLLIDGTSQAEEFVVAALGSELGSIQLVGGSSGDNWQLERSPILFEGRHRDDSALLLLVHTSLPFRHYNFHNFVPTERRGVITRATASERLVHEINGAPAATGYARLCGLQSEQVDREYVALHPAIITVGDRAYPRGFTEILDDGSLRCACAIDEGVVFRIAAQLDHVEQMSQALAQIRTELGASLLVLTMECAARRQTVLQHGLESDVSRLFGEYNVWGLNCMGEQSNSLNMNHTFNCLAFALPE